MLIINFTLHGLIIIRGDEPNFPFGFTEPIQAKVLQKFTGTFFVCTELAPQNSIFSIAKALRPNFFSAPHFIGIATDPNVQGTAIEFLTVSDQVACDTIVSFVMKATNNFEANQVSAIFDDGSGFISTTALNDANNAITGGIVQLATSTSRPTTNLSSNVAPSIKNMSNVFAAVRPNTGNFGDANSGIALMDLMCATSITFNTVDATTGQSGNTAQLLDATSPVLKGDLGGNNVLFSSDVDDINQVAFYYDNLFERLYIGVRIATGASAGDIGKSVVVGYVDNTNALILEPIAPDSAIDSALNQIVVAENSADQAGPNLRANYLSIMHTSAGPSYLIVQGGIGQTDEVGNILFALPLVDDPSDPTIHGTLADKNAALQNFTFTVPATTPDQLVTIHDRAGQVGAGPLPMLASDQISDMVVVGDAVFIALDLAPSAVNDTGIVYSQALFAADGAIVGWTPWTKKASPIDLFPQLTPSSGNVTLCDVDATTGNIYAIQNNLLTSSLVGITSWTEQISTDDTSLLNELNDVLTLGSYSGLDLPQSVRGFTGPGATTSRYALFGGVNQVVFTRISEAINQDMDAAQGVITDFSDPENFLVTQLPPEGGSVQVLEYSRRTVDEGDTNYFFAGTDNGLFVFTQTNGTGFNVEDLTALNQDPFIHGHWQKISEIAGSVIDIKTSGQALYLLTFETSAATPLANKLYKVTFEDTIEDMFNPFMNIRVLAQTQTEPVFDTVRLFTGIQIIATGDPTDADIAAEKEQLVLATNQGLYKSNADQMNNHRGIADADSQDEANWEIVQNTTNTMYTGISGIETPIRHTTWPIQVQDQHGCASFDASDIEQLNGNGDPTDNQTSEIGFAPLFFNASVDMPPFNALLPITYFFSDGARRFFIVNPTALSSNQTKLSVIPFDTQEWHVVSPHILRYPALQAIQRFFWVQTIGMSGLVLAGTNRGVIGLT